MTPNNQITVNLTSELRLEQALKQAGVDKPKTVTRLVVAGMLTFDDFKYLRKKMGKTLQELDMSNASVETNIIKEKTFSGCTALTSIAIPDSIICFEGAALRNTPFTAFTVHPDSQFFASENGVIFNKDKTELLFYPQGRQEKHYVIPDTVTGIGRFAFYRSVLTSITIPDSVKKIEYSAFAYSELISISIPDSVTEIGDSAFSSCDSLTSITIPNSVRKIGYASFWGCYRLTSVFIPMSVIEISSGNFSNCFKLNTITVHSDNPVYSSENGVLFNKDKTELIRFPMGYSGNYAIPNSVTKIERGAFWGCERLTSISIPISVKEIGHGAFHCCTGLTTITIPDLVTEIGSNTFWECRGLTNIEIPDSVTKIGNSAFECCTGLTTITIPDSVTEIGAYAFHFCTGLISITIPDSVTEIEISAFGQCPAFITVHANNPVYTSENGMLKKKNEP